MIITKQVQYGYILAPTLSGHNKGLNSWVQVLLMILMDMEQCKARLFPYQQTAILFSSEDLMTITVTVRYGYLHARAEHGRNRDQN